MLAASRTPSQEPTTPTWPVVGGGKAPEAASEPPRPPSVPPPAAPPARPTLNLPVISFRIVDDGRNLTNGKKDNRRDGVFSETSRGYGYNDSSSFERPEHYIRHIEPIESELKNQVEYDMDEQDQEWLDDINRERKRDNSDQVSYELFEIIVDRLEKEWFDLTKRIPDPKSSMPSEEAPCAVCDDGEGENSNAIVFCDGCNLAVHQDCYGVPYIPEGQWLCRKCTVSPENPVSCVLCPAEGGAFKQTSSGQWAHLLCAIWIPEVGVGNSVYMEPIDGIDGVPRGRWKLPCSICKQKGGACIQCDSKTCYTAFHVSCARENGMLGSMKALADHGGGGGSDGMLRGWCEKHVPDDVLNTYAQRHPNSHIAAQRINAKSNGGRKVAAVVIKKTKKSAKAYAKTYLPPPPLVPAVILDSIIDYVGRMPGRKKRELVDKVGKYWSLKREARRGAPLLKRLHLEPWTSNGARIHTEEEKAKKFEYLTRIRNDLEKVRMLSELCGKREKEKLRQTRVLGETVESFIYPYDAKMRNALNTISSFDKSEIFLHPVSLDDAPDYLQIITNPMDFVSIDNKITRHEYLNIQEFLDDVNLVFENAKIYNQDENPYHILAADMQARAAPVLEELSHHVQALSAVADVEDALSELVLSDLERLVSEDVSGDLEPALVHLNALLDLDSSMDDRIQAVDSLFAFHAAAAAPALSPAEVDGVVLAKEEESEPVELAEAVVAEPPRALSAVAEKKRAQRAEKEEKNRIRREKRQAEKDAVALATAAGEGTDALEPAQGPPPLTIGSTPARGSTRIKLPRTSFGHEPGSIAAADGGDVSLMDRQADSSPIKDDHDPAAVVAADGGSQKAGPSSRKRKRTISPALMDADALLSVSAIDSRASFAKFEQGWILPEGSKRGGRPIETREQSPIKNKKPRISLKPTIPPPVQEEDESAQAPSTSTQPADSEPTAIPEPDQPEAKLSRRKSRRGPASTDPALGRGDDSDSDLSDLSGSDVGADRDEDENNPPVIAADLSMDTADADQLAAYLAAAGQDTPAVQHTRARRSSAAVQPEAGPSEPSSSKPKSTRKTSTVVDSTPLHQSAPSRASGRSTRKSDVAEDAEPTAEELERLVGSGRTMRARRSSALSLPPTTPGPGTATRKGKERERVGESEGVQDVEMDEPDQDVKPPGPRSTKKAVYSRKQSKSNGKGKGKAGTRAGSATQADGFRHGDLVWSKTVGYPWYPAQVVVLAEVDPEEGDIEPSNSVLQTKVEGKDELLVRYFDHPDEPGKQSWSWVGRDMLKLLGEDKAEDERILNQKYKTGRQKRECRAAYEQAVEDMELPGESDDMVADA